MKRAFFLSMLCAVGVNGSAFAEDKGSWVDNLSLSGDFRLRHEWIKKEGSPNRARERIRARLALKAKANDEVDVTFKLASGNNDPISTNQTLTEGFSHKPVSIDMAFFDYHPQAAEGLHVFGGKMKNPFLMPGGSDLIWDGDLTPEGVAFAYGAGDDVKFLLNGGEFFTEERATDSETNLTGVQAGVEFKMGDSKLTVGAGYFAYSNVEGMLPVFDGKTAFGNTLKDVGTLLLPKMVYANEYKESELFVALDGKMGDLPLGLFGDYVKNGEADSLDTGYLAGFSIGKAKDPGTAGFKYYYRKLEKDAVLGAFTDSDFGGGGTDSKGHRLALEYALGKNTVIGLSYYINKVTLAHEVDYKRGQADVVFKY